MSGFSRADVRKALAEGGIDRVTIADLWTNFAGFVMPANASAVQRDEMRKAFYAGFFECFSLCSDVIPELPNAKGAEVLSRFHAEAVQFYEDLRKRGGG